MKILMTSLAEIRSYNPCVSGWKNILSAREHATEEDYEKQFPLIDCLNSNTVCDVLWLLGRRAKEISICTDFARKCADSVAHLNNVGAKHTRLYATEAAASAADGDYADANAAAYAAVQADTAATDAAADADAAAVDAAIHAADAATYAAADANAAIHANANAAAYAAADANAAANAAIHAAATYAAYAIDAADATYAAACAADAAYADAAAIQRAKNKQFLIDCIIQYENTPT